MNQIFYYFLNLDFKNFKLIIIIFYLTIVFKPKSRLFFTNIQLISIISKSCLENDDPPILTNIW
jgi:hypothetical protein